MGTYLTSDDIKHVLRKKADEAVEPETGTPPPTEAPAEEPPTAPAPPTDPMAPPPPPGETGMPGGPTPPGAPTQSPEDQLKLLETTLLQLIGEGLEAQAAPEDGGIGLDEDDPWYQMQQEGFSRVSPEANVQMMYPNMAPAIPGGTTPSTDEYSTDAHYEKTANDTMDSIVAFQKQELPLSKARELQSLMAEIISGQSNRADLVMPLLANAWARGFKDWDISSLEDVNEALFYSLQNPQTFDGIEEPEESSNQLEGDLYSEFD